MHPPSILVCVALVARVMDIPQICPLRNEGPETILHSLRDYHEAQVFWKAFPPPMIKNLFFGTKLEDWLRLNNRSSKVYSSSSITWGIIFPFGIWSLWFCKNDTIFRNASKSICSSGGIML